MRALPLDTSIKEMDIYVIVSQISNEVFVWKAKHPNSYQAYKDHANHKFKQTKELFERSEIVGKLPKLYVLETIIATQEEAFRYCVAWTKYFLERGYTSLSSSTLLSYTEDLIPKTDEIYQRIRNCAAEDVLTPERLLVSDYEKKGRPDRRVPKAQIKFTVTHEQYNHIFGCAEKENLSMARYCRNMVLEGHIITLEKPSIEEYITELRGVKIILRQILYAYYQNGKYYPADLENIQKLVDKVCDKESELLEEFRENTSNVMKLLPKK